MKIYLKALEYVSIGILGLTLLLTIMHYFNLLGDTAVNIIKLLIAIIPIIIGGFIVGKASDKKGWLEGLKLAGIIIGIFFIVTVVFRLGLNSKTVIYYLIIAASSTVGSMIGISTKEKS
jgi:putative membrane protein (TIGR04086 family)